MSQALRILRIRDGGKFSQMVLGQLTKLVLEGFTFEEALLVARWGRKKYDDEGDAYHCNLDPMYLWSTGKFALLLAAAQTGPRLKKDELSNISDLKERQIWQQDYERRLREKGIIQ